MKNQNPTRHPTVPDKTFWLQVLEIVLLASEDALKGYQQLTFPYGINLANHHIIQNTRCKVVNTSFHQNNVMYK